MIFCFINQAVLRRISANVLSKIEYMTGQQDVLVGEIGIPFFMNEQYKLWKHTNLIIDAIDGGGGMFSPDNGTGKRFLTRSEICRVP